jgi:phosphoglycerol transferase MdoB-like AlkP superfamily enzyme
LKLRLLFLLKYYLFWLLAFVFFRAMFILYNFKLYKGLETLEVLKSFFYGLQLDLSLTSYISILPFVLIAISSFFKDGKLFKKIILGYTLLILVLITLLCIVDIELFRWWGFRLDATIFKYASTPKEVIGTAIVSPLLLLFTLLLVSIVLLCFAYLFLVNEKNKLWKKGSMAGNLFTTLLILMITAALIIPIRGGFQLAPMNQSAVFYSNTPLLNHTAINVGWNFVHSILEKTYSDSNPYLVTDSKKADEVFTRLYSDSSTSSPILTTRNPNVIFIIWESFTGKVVKEMGGMENVTPQFSRLIKEGIFFNSIYASGNRSDKGLIAILSGYPAQPTTSIITNPKKALHLPAISTVLKNKAYHTSFYYGGEPEFANIKSFLLNHDFQKLVTKNDFEKKYWNSKWGAHDEIVLDRLLNDLENIKEPFFTTLFTLSSHEPYDIPMKPVFPGSDNQTLFLNSLYYTDQCLGKFIEKAKKTSWWKNTLIVITADHGHPYPSENGIPIHVPDEFKIPMLWLGGALKAKDITIDKLGSQTDIATTLLNQLNTSHKQFTFSKDLLSPGSKPFAYYAFNNGLGYILPRKALVFENLSHSLTYQKGPVNNKDITEGRTYLQYSFQDYLNK